MHARRKTAVRGPYLHWTKGMTRDLERLWNRGRTALEIGEILSGRYGKTITPSAAAGKAAYMGLAPKMELRRAAANG